MFALIEKLKLKLQILQLQLRVLLLKQKLTIPYLDAPRKIIIHHSASEHNFEQTNQYHKQLWGYKSSFGHWIGYTYWIERNGEIIQGRSDFETGAHTKGFNSKTIGICCVGNGEEREFTFEQYNSLKELVDRKMKEYGLTKQDLYGHYNLTATLCPSWRLKGWINSY